MRRFSIAVYGDGENAPARRMVEVVAVDEVLGLLREAWDLGGDAFDQAPHGIRFDDWVRERLGPEWVHAKTPDAPNP